MLSPAAELNRGPIFEQLRQRFPGAGKILKIASDSAQHISYLAAVLPRLIWQPSDLCVLTIRAAATA